MFSIAWVIYQELQERKGWRVMSFWDDIMVYGLFMLLFESFIYYNVYLGYVGA